MRPIHLLAIAGVVNAVSELETKKCEIQTQIVPPWTFEEGSSGSLAFDVISNCTSPSTSYTVRLTKSGPIANNTHGLQCLVVFPVSEEGKHGDCTCAPLHGAVGHVRCRLPPMQMTLSDNDVIWTLRSSGEVLSPTVKASISVTYPPVISHFSIGGDSRSHLTVSQGDRVDIRCEFLNGNPPSTMQLTNPFGRTLDQNTSRIGGMLESSLSTVQCFNSGQYHCGSDGAAGHRKTITLLVKCPLQVTSFAKNPNRPIQMGERFSLNLEISSHTKENINCNISREHNIWEDCGRNMTIDGAPPDLRVTVALRVVSPKDFGTWLLALSNGIGTSVYKNFPLNGTSANTFPYTQPASSDTVTDVVMTDENTDPTSSASELNTLPFVVAGLAVFFFFFFVVVIFVVKKNAGKRGAAGQQNVEVQDLGGIEDDGQHPYDELDDPPPAASGLPEGYRYRKGAGPHNDDGEPHLYNEILDDPPPSAGLPGGHRHHKDLPLPAVPSPAPPRPIKVANSLSGQRRAPPPTSLNQSAGEDSAACSYYTTPTATGVTAISSNDQYGLTEYLVPIPVTPATLKKKSPTDLSDISTYLTPVAPPSLKRK